MGTEARPAVIRVRNGYVVDVRQADDADGHDAETVDMPDTLILPLFANAHAHLDLDLPRSAALWGRIYLVAAIRHASTRYDDRPASHGDWSERIDAAGVGYVGDMVHSPSALEKDEGGAFAWWRLFSGVFWARESSRGSDHTIAGSTCCVEVGAW